MSYFTDNLWGLVVELGLEGVRGGEKVTPEKEEVLEKYGNGNPPEEFEDEEGSGRGKDDDGDDWPFEHEAPQLYGASWKFGSQWRRARAYFSDLTDYETNQSGIRKEEFWGKVRKWESRGKLIQKKGSYFRLNRFLWDEQR